MIERNGFYLGINGFYTTMYIVNWIFTTYNRVVILEFKVYMVFTEIDDKNQTWLILLLL